MSWFTNLRDSVEKVATLGLYDPAKSRQNERDQRQMINDQINAYKSQTELTRQQLEQTRAETEAQNRRVQEKQIRALRSSNRAQSIGMLGVGQPATSDMNSNLGG